MDNIWLLASINFVTQIAFIYTRTKNVVATARGEVLNVILWGSAVHLTWLISISLSTYSVVALIKTWEWSYLPVPIASLIGGNIGAFYGMKEKRNKL